MKYRTKLAFFFDFSYLCEELISSRWCQTKVLRVQHRAIASALGKRRGGINFIL